jgi:hypothetical protein
MSQGEGGGQPTKYRAHFVPIAKMLSRKGATDFEIATALGVSRDTFYLWMQTHPKFSDAVKLGKAPSDKRTERTLFERANGYSFPSEEIFLIEEVIETPAPTEEDPKATVITRTKKVLRVPTVKHVPPSDTAIIFWLKNRRKDKWRDFKAVEHSTDPKRPIGVMTYQGPQLLADYYAKIAASAIAADTDTPADRLVGPDGSGDEEPDGDEDFSPR